MTSAGETVNNHNNCLLDRDKEIESGFKVALNDSQRHTAKNKDNKAEQRLDSSLGQLIIDLCRSLTMTHSFAPQH